MNSKDMSSIMQQATRLTQTRPSEFWRKLNLIKKISYTAEIFVNTQSYNKILQQAYNGVREWVEEDESQPMLGNGLLPKVLPAPSKDDINSRLRDGQLFFSDVCGNNLCNLGKKKDLEKFWNKLLLAFNQFTANQGDYIPFLEMIRKSLKREKKNDEQ